MAVTQGSGENGPVIVTRSPLNMLKKGIQRLAGWLRCGFQSHNLLGKKAYWGSDSAMLLTPSLISYAADHRWWALLFCPPTSHVSVMKHTAWYSLPLTFNSDLAKMFFFLQQYPSQL